MNRTKFVKKLELKKSIKKLKPGETIETFSIYEKEFKEQRYDIIPRVFTTIQNFLKMHNIPLENVHLEMNLKKLNINLKH